MTDDELTEAEQARLRALVVFQKIVLGIALRWWRLYAIVFVAVGAILSSLLWMKGAKSVKRYEATTRLLFTPKKISRVDPPSDRQLMTILERSSLKRRVQDRVEMDEMERMCLSSDMKIAQGRKQTNLFTLTSASRTRKGAFAKVNAYADVLVDEYVAYRSKDLEIWRDSLEARRKEQLAKLSDMDAEESELKAKTDAQSPVEALVALNALISDQRRNDSALGVEISNEQIKKRKLEAVVGGNGETVGVNANAIRRRVDVITAIDAEIAQLREKYTDLNPKVAGRIQERAEKAAELNSFLKAKGAAGLDIDKIDQIEKAAGDLANCVTRLEAIREKRMALEKEIDDNEKKALALSGVVKEYERLQTRRKDVNDAIRDLDEQLGGISYAIGALRTDLRQIERSGGADDNGPLGPKKAAIAFGGAFVCASGLLFLLVAFELVFGKVDGAREVAVYDGISYAGSLPVSGAMPEDEAREVMGVTALKTLLCAKGAKTVFVCALPGAESGDAFFKEVDYTAAMSGARCCVLDVVLHSHFVPPENAEQMIGVVRSAQHAWFPAANRFALAPAELEMLKADIASLGESFDNVFVRIDGDVRIGGTFFDQMLGISGAVLLMIGAGSTPRRSFAFARRRLKPSGKPVFAILTGASVKSVRADMEVFS